MINDGTCRTHASFYSKSEASVWRLLLATIYRTMGNRRKQSGFGQAFAKLNCALLDSELSYCTYTKRLAMIDWVQWQPHVIKKTECTCSAETGRKTVVRVDFAMIQVHAL